MDSNSREMGEQNKVSSYVAHRNMSLVRSPALRSQSAGDMRAGLRTDSAD